MAQEQFKKDDGIGWGHVLFTGAMAGIAAVVLGVTYGDEIKEFLGSEPEGLKNKLDEISKPVTEAEAELSRLKEAKESAESSYQNVIDGMPEEKRGLFDPKANTITYKLEGSFAQNAVDSFNAKEQAIADYDAKLQEFNTKQNDYTFKTAPDEYDGKTLAQLKVEAEDLKKDVEQKTTGLKGMSTLGVAGTAAGAAGAGALLSASLKACTNKIANGKGHELPPLPDEAPGDMSGKIQMARMQGVMAARMQMANPEMFAGQMRG